MGEHPWKRTEKKNRSKGKTFFPKISMTATETSLCVMVDIEQQVSVTLIITAQARNTKT